MTELGRGRGPEVKPPAMGERPWGGDTGWEGKSIKFRNEEDIDEALRVVPETRSQASTDEGIESDEVERLVQRLLMLHEEGWTKESSRILLEGGEGWVLYFVSGQEGVLVLAADGTVGVAHPERARRTERARMAIWLVGLSLVLAAGFMVALQVLRASGISSARSEMFLFAFGAVPALVLGCYLLLMLDRKRPVASEVAAWKEGDYGLQQAELVSFMAREVERIEARRELSSHVQRRGSLDPSTYWAGEEWSKAFREEGISDEAGG